jgi:hypothetical protein
MPNRPVQETFLLKQYKIGKKYGEAIFNRTYKSSMLHSPDHLIFITGLIHTQKLLYAVLCHEFKLEYDTSKAEVLKIWPTFVNVEMPKMIRDTRNILQKLRITEINPTSPISKEKYDISFITTYQDSMLISGKAFIYII